MPTIRITKDLKDKIYFVTFTVHNWYYLFDRHGRFEILEKSFIFCQQKKELRLHAFVFMLNHLHFIGQAPDLIGVIRDMKTFISKELQKNILATEPNILKLFENKGKYNFWQPSNHPELIEKEEFLNQKINYIHNNPVQKQYVHYPEDWVWSSASKITTGIEINQI
jgi:putative transposase